MKYALEAVGVSKSFGGVMPARDVTFTIRSGELRCLIGPNGAGKSTLFKLIVGIEKADSGEIKIFGSDVSKEPTFRRVRRGVGVKLQSNHAYKNLDVGHNLRVADILGKRRRPSTRKGIGAGVTREEALSRFELNRAVRENCVVRTLSHAEQQWLEICCTISSDVGVLLLDEPTAGMGVEETSETGQVLKELQSRGMTIVVVEHDMQFVREVADHVTVLHQGKVFAEGTMEDLAARADVRDIYLG